MLENRQFPVPGQFLQGFPFQGPVLGEILEKLPLKYKEAAVDQAALYLGFSRNSSTRPSSISSSPKRVIGRTPVTVASLPFFRW